MKRVVLILIFFGVVIHMVEGQDMLKIQGTVVDDTSKEPLPFATVKILHRSEGTITNTQGKFVVTLHNLGISDTLYISMLGYKPFKIPISKINSEIMIPLTSVAVVLEEVVIEDDLDPSEILKRVAKNFKKNYPSRQFSYEGFYREIKKADDKYVSLIEAVATIYSDGYKLPRHEKVAINELRKTIGFKHPYANFWNNSNLLWHLLHLNAVRYDHTDFLKYPTPSREPDAMIDGKPVFVLSFTAAPYWPTKFYIRCDNFAIVRIEEKYDYSAENEKTWKLDDVPFVQVHAVKRDVVVTYKEIDQIYYPESIRLNHVLDYRNSMTQESVLLFGIDHLFVVTDVMPSRADIPKEKLMDNNVSFEEMELQYNPPFWSSYQTLIDTPLDSAIRRELEGEVGLEERFLKK